MKAQVLFNASQFTTTKFHTQEDKAKFANHFTRFFLKDCPRSLFHKGFYTQLSFMWHHIAHYNVNGFYATWFDADSSKIEFLQRCIETRPSGSPSHTYCDVEIVLADWIRKSDILGFYQLRLSQEHEAAERGMLAFLQSKYK